MTICFEILNELCDTNNYKKNGGQRNECRNGDNNDTGAAPEKKTMSTKRLTSRTTHRLYLLTNQLTTVDPNRVATKPTDMYQ